MKSLPFMTMEEFVESMNKQGCPRTLTSEEVVEVLIEWGKVSFGDANDYGGGTTLMSVDDLLEVLNDHTPTCWIKEWTDEQYEAWREFSYVYEDQFYVALETVSFWLEDKACC